MFNRENKVDYIKVIFILIIFVEILTTIHTAYRQSLNSDLAAELLFAKDMVANQMAYPATWYPTTDMPLRGPGTFLLTAIYLVAGYFRYDIGFHEVFAICSFMQICLVLLSLSFVLRALDIRGKLRLLTISLFICPIGLLWYWGMKMPGYCFYILICFFVLGTYICLMTRENVDVAKKAFLYAGIAILSFYAGFCGIRYFLLLFVPMILTEIVYTGFFRDRQKVSAHSFGFISFISFVAIIGHIMLGLLMSKMLPSDWNQTLGSKWYKLYLVKVINFDSIWSCFQYFGLERFIGYNQMRQLVLVVGIVGIWAWIFVYKKLVLTKPKSACGGGRRIYDWLFLFGCIQLLSTILLCIITSMGWVDAKRYLALAAMTLLLECLLLHKTSYFGFIDKFLNWGKTQEVIYYIAISIILTVCISKNWTSAITPDANEAREGYLTFLGENGYHAGAATYWNANVSTILSGEQVTIKAVYNEEGFPDYRFGIDSSAADMKSEFLLLTVEEYREAAEKGYFKGENRILYHDAYFYVLRY